jgi:hypothetical protein
MTQFAVAGVVVEIYESLPSCGRRVVKLFCRNKKDYFCQVMLDDRIKVGRLKASHLHMMLLDAARSLLDLIARDTLDVPRGAKQ